MDSIAPSFPPKTLSQQMPPSYSPSPFPKTYPLARLCDAQVAQLRLEAAAAALQAANRCRAGADQQHVGRLDVAVDGAARVHRAQAEQDLPGGRTVYDMGS